MHYDRTLIAYHGCDRRVAERLLRGEPFVPSENDYDWLGRGIYFWEFGLDRALQFAQDQQRRGRLRHPAVVGAVLQLGRCFDLMDTRFTANLGRAHRAWLSLMRRGGRPLPENVGGLDRLLRRRDCAVLNWFLQKGDWDSVRCGFVEGPPVYPGAGIHEQSHVQLAIRNPACIIGTFRPNMEPS
jgi:hypothetical protein